MPKPLPDRVAAQRKDVVMSVLSALDRGDLTWITEWAAGSSPHNATSGLAYRGVNRLNLTFAARIRGFSDPRFVTYRQAQERGWHVRKGAKSFPVEKWKSFTIHSDDPDVKPRVGLACVGYYTVFNLEEVVGVPEYDPQLPPLTPSRVTEIADRLIATSRCPIIESDEGRAVYSPTRDDIHVPDRRLFLGSDDYRARRFVATLAHEMCHSTMKPLHRTAGDYAREELVAELGACFVSSDVGLPLTCDTDDPHFRQHAAYIQSWSRLLQDKPTALFSAAAHADKAADYIMSRYRGTSDEDGE